MPKTLVLTNDSGIVITKIEHEVDDKVVFFRFEGDKKSKEIKSIIRYNSKGNAYFKSGGNMFYISEFV